MDLKNTIGCNNIWFKDLDGGFALSLSEQTEMAKHVFSELTNDPSNNTISDRIISDKKPRIVFLSISSLEPQAFVAIGAGEGILDALKNATKEALNREIEKNKIRGIKLDFVTKSNQLGVVDLTKTIEIDKSLEGLAFNSPFQLAFLPGQLQAHRIINNKGDFQPKNVTKVLNNSPDLLEQFNAIKNHELYSFKTSSIYYDGMEPNFLYRGSNRHTALNGEILLSAAKNAGDYLVNALNDNGKFNYSYRPLQDRVSDDYNILRHSGTIYAMLELFEQTKEEALLIGAKKAIQYLLEFVKPITVDHENLNCIVEKGYIKLGGNALAVLALSKYTAITNDSTHLPLARNLALWIKSAQKPSGEFAVFKQHYASGKVTDFVSGYYPGEAIFSLGCLYSVDPDERWLDVAEKGALYLINQNKDVPVNKLIHDHWLLYGLSQLFKLAPDKRYVEHSMNISQAIIGAQIKKSQYKDWLGGFYNPPRTTPTSIRMEGLCAAYELARITGNKKMMKSIFGCVEEGIKFLLQIQYNDSSVLYLPNPRRALGGFRQSLTIFETRIDYVQHAISALFGLRRIM